MNKLIIDKHEQLLLCVGMTYYSCLKKYDDSLEEDLANEFSSNFFVRL